MPSFDPTLLFLLGAGTGLLASSLGTWFFLRRRYNFEFALAGQESADQTTSRYTYKYPYTAPVGATLKAVTQKHRPAPSPVQRKQAPSLRLGDTTLSNQKEPRRKPYAHAPIAVPPAPVALQPFSDRAATPQVQTERPTFRSLRKLLEGIPVQASE